MLTRLRQSFLTRRSIVYRIVDLAKLYCMVWQQDSMFLMASEILASLDLCYLQLL